MGSSIVGICCSSIGLLLTPGARNPFFVTSIVIVLLSFLTLLLPKWFGMICNAIAVILAIGLMFSGSELLAEKGFLLYFIVFGLSLSSSLEVKYCLSEDTKTAATTDSTV